jgi:hypothetical protein
MPCRRRRAANGTAGHAPALTAGNLPPISMDPAPEARISVAAGAIEVPE